MNTELLLERLARVEGRVEEHSRMVEDVPGRLTNLEGKVDRLHSAVDARFDSLTADVNARFTRADERMEAGFARVDERMDALGHRLDGRIDRLESTLTRYFTWMIGLTMTAWLSLIVQGLRAR